MDAEIIRTARGLSGAMVACRRDLHKHAEAAWTEFRTASIVGGKLQQLGFEVQVGDQVVDGPSMMGVPSEAELLRHAERAVGQGAERTWVERMRGGKTGVVGVMRFGRPGPTVALRVDMDANDLVEADDPKHRPAREGFASVNRDAMHACGHDGHTAMGLGVAEILAGCRGELAGTLKLIFQPAEEGVRGAKAMTARGVVDDVDYVIGAHLGVNLRKTGQVACRTEGFLATTKFDATFTGVPAHAGAAPETGRNAIVAAATAILNLHAIPRHSAGASRVNVGVVQGGTGRNVVPAHALIKVETRGETTRINEYVYAEAVRIVEAAAAMQGLKVAMQLMGGAAGCLNDASLVERIEAVAKRQKLFSEFLPAGNIGGSEDCTYFMERVQQRGGQAAFVMIGTELTAGHHDCFFDFNEKALVPGAALLAGAAADLLTGGSEARP
ncbi:MAG TPA: amidohydrolase [Candidatus Baltobacteraceae bacterium]|nr:amidohydrolase [Candidatus Baltobacteraceae bacterium]